MGEKREDFEASLPRPAVTTTARRSGESCEKGGERTKHRGGGGARLSLFYRQPTRLDA